MARPIHIDTARIARLKVARGETLSTPEFNAWQRDAMKEDAYTDELVRMAHAYGWLAMHSRPALTAKGYRTPILGNAGFVDLVLAKEGRLWLWELKTSTGRVRPEQQTWLDALPPEMTMVLRPTDIDRAEEMLR